MARVGRIKMALTVFVLHLNIINRQSWINLLLRKKLIKFWKKTLIRLNDWQKIIDRLIQKQIESQKIIRRFENKLEIYIF